MLYKLVLVTYPLDHSRRINFNTQCYKDAIELLTVPLSSVGTRGNGILKLRGVRGKWVTPLARTVYPLHPANCNIWKKMMIQIWGLVCCPTTCRSLFEDHFGPSLTMSMCGATDLTDRTASPIRINQKVAWTRHNFWHNVGNTFLMLLVSVCHTGNKTRRYQVGEV